MNRELIVFVLFLFINVSLSINCFFYQYAGRKAKLAREEIKKETKANKPFYKSEIIPSLTKSFNEILDIKIEKENPHRIRFFMKDTKDICLTLSHIKSIYRGSELEYCKNNPDINYINSKWIIAGDNSFEHSFDQSIKVILNQIYPEKILLEVHKDTKKKSSLFNWDTDSRKISQPKLLFLDDKELKDFLKAGNDKLEENNSALFIVSSSSSKTYVLIFSDKYVAKLKKMKLLWDIKLEMEQANGSQTTQLREAFWEVMKPVGYVVDVITFPFQVIGGFIYIMIFGIK